MTFINSRERYKLAQGHSSSRSSKKIFGFQDQTLNPYALLPLCLLRYLSVCSVGGLGRGGGGGRSQSHSQNKREWGQS